MTTSQSYNYRLRSDRRKSGERLAALPNTEIRISDHETENAGDHQIPSMKFGLQYCLHWLLQSFQLSKRMVWNGNIRATNAENPHIIKTALATFEPVLEQSATLKTFGKEV